MSHMAATKAFQSCDSVYRRLERHGWCKKSFFLTSHSKKSPKSQCDLQRANGNAGAGGGGMKVKKKKLKFQKLLGVNATYTMVKEQCDCLNVCVYYSTSMTTIICRGTPHLIYLGPIYIHVSHATSR